MSDRPEKWSVWTSIQHVDEAQRLCDEADDLVYSPSGGAAAAWKQERAALHVAIATATALVLLRVHVKELSETVQALANAEGTRGIDVNVMSR